MAATAQENLIAILIVAVMGTLPEEDLGWFGKCYLMYPVQPADRLAYILGNNQRKRFAHQAEDLTRHILISNPIFRNRILIFHQDL